MTEFGTQMLEYRIAIVILLIVLGIVALKFRINMIFGIILTIFLGVGYLILSYYSIGFADTYLLASIVVIFGHFIIRYGFGKTLKNNKEED